MMHFKKHKLCLFPYHLSPSLHIHFPPFPLPNFLPTFHPSPSFPFFHWYPFPLLFSSLYPFIFPVPFPLFLYPFLFPFHSLFIPFSFLFLFLSPFPSPSPFSFPFSFSLSRFLELLSLPVLLQDSPKKMRIKRRH